MAKEYRVVDKNGYLVGEFEDDAEQIVIMTLKGLDSRRPFRAEVRDVGLWEAVEPEKGSMMSSEVLWCVTCNFSTTQGHDLFNPLHTIKPMLLVPADAPTITLLGGKMNALEALEVCRLASAGVYRWTGERTEGA